MSKKVEKYCYSFLRNAVYFVLNRIEYYSIFFMVNFMDKSLDVIKILKKTYPEAKYYLDFKTPLDLVVAAVLSAAAVFNQENEFRRCLLLASDLLIMKSR